MGIYNLGGGGGAPELQAKEETPLITNAQQIIVPDEGYDGLSKVTVNPMPTGTLKTPTVNSIGYVSSGVQTAGYFDTSATSGLQLSTQAAKTITPTTYSQTAVAKGKYTTGDVTVGAVSLQSKTVDANIYEKVIRPDNGYVGLSQVNIKAANLTINNKATITSYTPNNNKFSCVFSQELNRAYNLWFGARWNPVYGNINIIGSIRYANLSSIQYPYTLMMESGIYCISSGGQSYYTGGIIAWDIQSDGKTVNMRIDLLGGSEAYYMPSARPDIVYCVMSYFDN